MKMKNVRNCILVYFFYENEKRMRALKIQSIYLLNMKIVSKYLNFVFHTKVKNEI